MRILVTRGAGFIGSNLTDRLIADGHYVTVLDNFSTGSKDNLIHLENSSKVQVIEGSILDAQLVNRLVSQIG